MMGNSATTRKGPCRRALAPRSAISAIMVPSAVVPVAVHSARNKVFQATPQRWPPARHDSPQTRSLPMRSCKASSDHCPCSFRNAPCRALTTGKAMNSTSSTEQPTTAEATNRSPLKKPSRATPNDEIITSASRARKAPMPMPNWLRSNSPSHRLRNSNDHPRAPIMKPNASRPANPSTPPASNQRPWALPGGTARPMAATHNPARPTASHTRPWARIWTMPLAVSAPPKICPITVYQAVSWIAYQGRMT